jgi:hypothetical protein
VLSAPIPATSKQWAAVLLLFVRTNHASSINPSPFQIGISFEQYPIIWIWHEK